jgi:hypothetical protein
MKRQQVDDDDDTHTPPPNGLEGAFDSIALTYLLTYLLTSYKDKYYDLRYPQRTHSGVGAIRFGGDDLRTTRSVSERFIQRSSVQPQRRFLLYLFG